MPIEHWKHVTRADVKANRDKLFLFGDNLMHTGFGGQAREMRGEPNAYGVPTKFSPDVTPEAYFKDSDAWIVMPEWNRLFAGLRQLLVSGMTIVIPQSGIGTGRAELSSRAPKLAAILARNLETLVHVAALARPKDTANAHDQGVAENPSGHVVHADGRRDAFACPGTGHGTIDTNTA